MIHCKSKVCKIRHFCQRWPAKFGQILLRTDTRLVFCIRKLMKTDILFTRTTKHIFNFVNPGKFLLKITVTLKLYFNLTLTVARNTFLTNLDKFRQVHIRRYMYNVVQKRHLTVKENPSLSNVIHWLAVFCNS